MSIFKSMSNENDNINQVTSKKPKSLLWKKWIIILILVLINPFSLYFFQLLLGEFFSYTQEAINGLRCKIIDKNRMIIQVWKDVLNERFVISCASKRWWLNDKEFVLKMVKHHWYTFIFIADELKNDRDVVLEAVKNGANIYFWIFDNDKEVVLEAVRKNGKLLEWASPELKNDQEILFEAMKNYLWALEYASPELKNNREVVIDAIKMDRGNIKYASSELKNDRDIALEALKKSPYAYDFLSKELKADPEIIKASKKKMKIY